MDVTSFSIVALYAGLNVFILLAFITCSIRVRRREKISIGDGGDVYLSRLMRGHANAVENMPMFFVLLALGAAMNVPNWVLHILGASFTLARLLHASYFIRRKSDFRPRVFGTGLSMSAMGFTALTLIGYAVFYLVNSA